MYYKLYVPFQASGANAIYWDLWNPAGSGYNLVVKSIQPIVSGAVAVTGVVAVDMFLSRTTAVGTSGTAATKDGTSLTACTISGMDTDQPLDGISARLTPTGGATSGAVLAKRSVYTEEASSQTYTPAVDMARHGQVDIPGVKVKPGSGLKVIQGAVASVGQIGFDVIFEAVPA